MKNALSRTVRVIAFLIFISGILLTQSVVAQNQPPIQVGENIRSIIFDTLTREYLLYIPKGYDSKTPLPLVLLFHGGGMNATEIMDMSGFAKVADEKRFIIAASNYAKGAIKNHALTYDIVKFSKMFIGEISTIVAIDKKRIYAAGYSRGGFVCGRLASELSTEIAAAGMVAGLYPPMKSPPRAVSVIAFHGTEDKTNRYSDSVVPNWVENNECKGTPITRKISEDVTQTIYGSCKDNSEVILFLIKEGGHTWPGGPRADFSVESGFGKTNKDINATNLIWSFFEAHPLP